VKRVKVTRTYHVPLPPEVIDKLGIEVGDEFLVLVEGDKIVLEKVGETLPTYFLGKGVGEGEIKAALERGFRKALGEVVG